MTLYKHITIKWSYPTEIDKILQTEDMNDIGIYYISRVFGKKESILYIGKTTHSFGSRLESHKEKWLDKYKGTKYVRLGRIVHPRFIFSKKRKALINDAERTIIFYLYNNIKILIMYSFGLIGLPRIGTFNPQSNPKLSD